MTKFNFLLVSLLLLSFNFSTQAQNTLKERLEKHVYTLADDSLQGREAGTIYTEKASEYIINQLEEIGIEPYFEGSYLQSFDRNQYNNIVGIISGNDEQLKHEYIIVGAHYDHIGVRNGNIYNGADDNASGVATLIELARALKAKQSEQKRSVLLIAFDAEEKGLLGSQYFIENTNIPNEKIKLMISVDMVGWYKVSQEIKYIGSGTILNGKKILENPLINPDRLNVVVKNYEKSIFTATDTQPFAEKGIPTLAVTTGTKSPYHKPEDDANLIDYEGMSRITKHLTSVVEAISNDVDFKPSGKLAKKHRKQEFFTIGITGNIGSNHHYYTDGAVDGKSATSMGLGVTTQINFGNFAIRPEIFYEQINAKHPNGRISTDNITVPMSIVFQEIHGGSGVDLFVGGYYSYRFNGKQGVSEFDFFNEYKLAEFGMTYGLGLYIRPFKIGFTNRTAFSPMTKYPNSDNAHLKNRANYFTISYQF